MERIGGRAWRRVNLGRQGDARAYDEGGHVVLVRSWEPDAAGEDAPTIVLVHGIGMGQQYFGLLRDALVSSARVIAVDLPGFGDSPEPPTSLPIPAMAALLGRALDTLVAEPVVALGHSMGTQVVAELAAQRADLVDRVVLIAPTVNSAERSFGKQALRLLEDLANDPPIVGLVGLKMYAQAGPRWFMRKFRSMIEHRIEQVAPEISQPTLVMRGAEDTVCPADWVRSVAELIPDARMETADGKGHEAMITGAEPVARMVLEFLRDRADR